MNQLPALDSADYGLGERIAQALKDLDKSPDSNTVLSAGKGRKINQWIYRIPEGEDIKTMVAKLSKASKKKSLPVVLYSRARGLNTLSPDQSVSVKSSLPFGKEALRMAKVDVAWLELSYSITTMANSREEAEALMLMWFFHVSKKTEGNHKISMNYEIAGKKYPLEGFIVDPTMLMAADFSFPEERLYGLRQDFTIQVPCLYGESVETPPDMRIGFNIEAVM